MKKNGGILRIILIAYWGLDPLKWPPMWPLIPLNMPLLSPHLRQPYKNTLADSALKGQALSQFITITIIKNLCYILQCQYPQTGGLDPPQGALFIVVLPPLGYIMHPKYLHLHTIAPQFNFRAYHNQVLRPFVFQAKNEGTIFSTPLEKYLLQIILMSSSPLSYYCNLPIYIIYCKSLLRKNLALFIR